MFELSARFYDKLYASKDYRAETEKLLETLRRYKPSLGDDLLDVACGTGRHLAYLKESFRVEGLDLALGLLEAARERLPEVIFHQADMTDFILGRQFDVVTCLFSSIGYVKTLEALVKTVNGMTSHLAPGGVLLIEPWFTPETWHPGSVHALFIDEPELKIARFNTSGAKGRLSFMDFHYLIGTPQGVEHFTERHELGLFTAPEMQAALAGAGLRSEYDPQGLTGRGLHIGVKPL
jgi:ubiquinone/menaquinone biosynthesis C-methylase UbiE